MAAPSLYECVHWQESPSMCSTVDSSALPVRVNYGNHYSANTSVNFEAGDHQLERCKRRGESINHHFDVLTITAGGAR